jgi:hypothetical protein
MKPKQIRVTDNDIIRELNDFLSGCDTDALCSVAKEWFGGRWSYDPENDEFILTPNKAYAGAFDAYIEKE